MSGFDVTPDDTIWYPDASRMGDFSNWRQQFDDKIALYCNTDDTFESTRFKSNYGEVVWNSTFSEDGYLKINDILDNGAISPYISSKAGWITVIVLGIVCLLAGLVFSFALRKGFRNLMARFCGNRCRDRPRMPLEQVGTTRMTILGGFVVLALLTFGIVELYSAVRIKQAAQAVACDFWRTSKAHFFGALTLNHDNLVDNGIVPDWKGTVEQHSAMMKLGRHVNATDATNEARRTIENYYFDMKDQLVGSMNRVVTEINSTKKSLVLMKRLASVKWNEAWGNQTWQGRTTPLTCDFCEMASGTIDKYANDLIDTTYDGINLFESNLAIYLNTNSSMLLASYGTAMTGMLAILDVDIMMSKILMVWDLKVAPMLFPAISALVALGCLLGIFGLLLAVAIAVLSFMVLKARKNNENVKPKVAASWAGVYIALMVIGSGGMILSGIFFLLGSAGGDICTFMDSELFENGHWKSLPSIVWNETYTNRTNLPTVLDACMKKTGDGDVAAATGLAMLLTRLEDGVARVEKELTKKVEIALDLKVKNERTGMLQALMNDAQGQVSTVAKFSNSDYGAETRGKKFQLGTTNYTTQYLCAYPLLGSTVMEIALDCANGATPFVYNVSKVSYFMDKALHQYLKKEYDEVVEVTKQPIGGFCFDANPEDCPDETYMHITKDTVFTKAGIEHETLKQLGTKVTDDRILFLFELGGMVSLQRRFLEVTMDKVYEYSDESWRTTWNDTLAVYDELRTQLGKPVCEVCHQHEPNTTTTIEEVLNFLQRDSVELGQFLWDNFVRTNDRINRFVLNETIGTFERLLAGARENLEDFNCQFIGTAMQNGMERGLCKVLMPSASMTGLAAILIWAVCFVGTFWAWRMYHYLRDLEVESGTFALKFDAVSTKSPMSPAEEKTPQIIKPEA